MMGQLVETRRNIFKGLPKMSEFIFLVEKNSAHCGTLAFFTERIEAGRMESFLIDLLVGHNGDHGMSVALSIAENAAKT